MNAFEYVGQLPSGTAISGTLEAASPDEARALLSGMQIHVTSLAAAPAIRRGRALSREDLLYFNQQLAGFAESGITLDKGLRAMARDLSRGRLKSAIESLADEVERGVPLDQAAAGCGGAFPPLYCDILRAGAQTGRLGEALFNLNHHLTLMESSRRAFWEAATYPIAILLLSAVVLSFFMTTVVPQFEVMLVDASQMAVGFGVQSWFTPAGAPAPPQLPLVTALVLDAARHWPQIAIVFLAVVAVLLVGNVVFARVPALAGTREAVLLGLPWFRRMVRANLVARFSQAAALGARAGWDLPVVVRAAAAATGSPALMADAERLGRHIEAGGLPEQSAMQTRIIPAVFGYTAQIAGGRGQLSAGLGELARDFDALAQHHYRMLRGTLAPLFILVTAIVIGLLLLALFMPLAGIFNIMTSLV